MNYFELFEIPVSLNVDKTFLQKKYFELQKKYHPDFFSNADEHEQSEMLERSSMINRAFKTFQNDDETIKYVLQLKNLLEEEEKYNLPPDFLMEMMEINEALTEGDETSLQVAENNVAVLGKNLYDEIKPIIENYKDEQATNDELLQIKNYYYKKKYLKRILERLEGMRNIASQN